MSDQPTQIVIDAEVIGEALKEAGRRAVALHRAFNRPLVVAGPDGAPRWVMPEDIPNQSSEQAQS